MFEDPDTPNINDGIVGSQALGLASNFILMEVVVQMARQSEWPLSFVDKLHEHVFARLDQAPSEQETSPVQAYARETIDRFFTNAKRTLQK